jgi:hypothetical protein
MPDELIRAWFWARCMPADAVYAPATLPTVGPPSGEWVGSRVAAWFARHWQQGIVVAALFGLLWALSDWFTRSMRKYGE